MQTLVQFKGYNRNGVCIRDGKWEFSESEVYQHIETLCKSMTNDKDVVRITVDIALPKD